MPIQTGETIDAGDFVSTSSGAADEGKVAKLNSDGRFDTSFLGIEFGDGSDGAVNMDGTNTFAGFASKSGNIYTLTRDVYATDLTIASGVTLRPDGYKVYVADTLSGAGTIEFDGNDGGHGAQGVGGTPPTGGVGGTESGSGPLKTTAGLAGGQGADRGASAPAVPTPTAVVGLGTTGRQGGDGGGSGATSPAGGSCSITQKYGIIRWLTLSILDLTTALDLVLLRSQGQSTGGGGGSAAASGDTFKTGGSGGGSGASGGIVFIVAKIWAGTFTISVRGGDGGDGGDGAFGGAGGGPGSGGNGGISIVIYGRKTWTGSYVLTGGTAGAVGTGSEGNGATAENGATGVSFEIPVLSLL